MDKQKKSGSAIFMYVVIAITIVTSIVCFGLYYSDITNNKIILWSGIVSFMIMYHLWVRIIMGNVSKIFKINRDHWWFKEKPFEKKLYKFLRVKKWKNKALTYNPELFSLKEHSVNEIATVMTKAELDHWLNQLISLSSILFAILWGKFWIFLITAIAAMIFDGQFIVIQRYNRPRVLRILKKENDRLLNCNDTEKKILHSVM